jgi:ribonuclease-3 family protein
LTLFLEKEYFLEANLDQCSDQTAIAQNITLLSEIEKQGNLQNFLNCPGSISPELCQQFAPSLLAYVGDAVYELYVRTRYLQPPKHIRRYHQVVVSQVCAEGQAHHLHQLIPHLSDQEMNIVRRGRNAAAKPPKRLPREIYQQATSFEVLVGFLFLTDPQRLEILLGTLVWPEE